jgi:hypothetical protein
VKYSSKWQKMKRRIMQEFHLKWKRWLLFKWEEEYSLWVKLPPRYGSLKPEGKYKLVVRPQDKDKRIRPGKLRRHERRQAERQETPGVKKLQTFRWSADDQGSQLQKELNVEHAAEPNPRHITIQKRQPSPPLEIIRKTKEVEKVWVDIVLDEDWKGMEVLATATQRDIEVQARSIFDTAVNIKNFRAPINGIKYYCVVDHLGNQKHKTRDGSKVKSRRCGNHQRFREQTQLRDLQ